jgi:hypothetical protein
MSAWRLLLHIDHPAVAAVAFAFVQLMWARMGFAQNPGTTGSGESTPIAAAAPAASDSRERGLLPEPRWLTRAMEKIAVRTDAPPSQKDGFYPAIGSTMAGAGWITAGPGYRHHIAGSWLAYASAGASWHGYLTAEAATSADLGKAVSIGAQALWQDQTQLVYFGSHDSSRLSDATEYRLRASDYTASAAFHMPGDWSIQVGAGLMPEPELVGPTGWHDRGFPDTRRLFNDASAPGLGAQPSLWHGNLSVAINRLDEPGHPTEGWLAHVEAAAYRDRDFGRFLFNRYQADLVEAVPLTAAHMWTLLLRESAVLTATPYGDQVPFYLEPALGGQNLLRGYVDYRFHDRNVAALQIESRWAVLAHIDGALFVDLGVLAPTVSAFGRADLKTAYGGGIRIHTAKNTLVRIDLGRSPEGWRWLVQYRDPFRLSLFRRRAAVLPLLP